jgi:hypothetical protein
MRRGRIFDIALELVARRCRARSYLFLGNNFSKMAKNGLFLILNSCFVFFSSRF